MSYVIWHHVRNDRISDLKEVVGIVHDRLEADAVVQKLNDTDPDRKEWSRSLNYWKEEFPVLTSQNVLS